ncbi:sigma 54-interacting transcriptional regulator [Pseudoprimorskyibacter insulae]|uniref:Nif-specific regulatory protein n=1 Tax=Pseudoprimorskyibacter insulae TaxID=1695997 RepID=A0A2R8AVM9_9RHOB|nr:sigma-54 dependent transcriptional regulator [Pseudoprimorskyibacter insulae]SPF80078.1 Transcriptional regulatory protein GlrR [Pseudoprimorskyibacter insulae]
MNDLLLIASELNAATGLVDLLSRRRVAVTEDAKEKAAALVCSAAHETSLGGQRALVELARTAGAKQIHVIHENADAFAVEEELGGRLQRIHLPQSGTAVLSNGPMMLLADLIASAHAPMVAADAATGALIDMATRVAGFDVGVFINGPSGSGKEVLARTIHEKSPRAGKPFIAINCAAIPENMLESVLFGHEKGAFTGATTANTGIMRAADGGTLLLDEISEMPLSLQAKLLRVLQERKVTPLGTQKEIEVDIRVIATSNRDMEIEVQKGTFREDLYYRLNVFPLETTALAQRSADVPVLAQAMLRRHTGPGQTVPLLSADACAILAKHSWPGNVRELENVMQRALVLCDGQSVRPQDIMLNARTAALRPVRAA